MVRILEGADLSDFTWRDSPGAWHQQMTRIVDHRFSSFDELYTFALNAKQAGVSAVMLVEIQKTSACPGPWYNGLQLCDHINGSYPAPDGSLPQWRQMLREIAPMRLMWWTNMVSPSPSPSPSPKPKPKPKPKPNPDPDPDPDPNPNPDSDPDPDPNPGLLHDARSGVGAGQGGQDVGRGPMVHLGRRGLLRHLDVPWQERGRARRWVCAG